MWNFHVKVVRFSVKCQKMSKNPSRWTSKTEHLHVAKILVVQNRTTSCLHWRLVEKILETWVLGEWEALNQNTPLAALWVINFIRYSTSMMRCGSAQFTVVLHRHSINFVRYSAAWSCAVLHNSQLCFTHTLMLIQSCPWIGRKMFPVNFSNLHYFIAYCCDLPKIEYKIKIEH